MTRHQNTSSSITGKKRQRQRYSETGLLDPESTDPKLTRPSGSGNFAQNSTRHGNPGFALCPIRDVATAKAIFRKALGTQRRAPVSIALDGYAASHRAVREMPREDDAWKHTKLRASKYLNNLSEQDHRGIKSRTGPMPVFKDSDCAAIFRMSVSGQEPGSLPKLRS
jgi:hypothetical protein